MRVSNRVMANRRKVWIIVLDTKKRSNKSYKKAHLSWIPGPVSWIPGPHELDPGSP